MIQYLNVIMFWNFYYRVDKKKLIHLDELEDYPRLYSRRAEKIHTENGEVTLVKIEDMVQCTVQNAF